MAAKKKGEGGLEKDLPECRCYMRVTGVENIGGEGWHLIDFTGVAESGYQDPAFCIDGLPENEAWKWCTGGSFFEYGFPTPFRELNPPSSGNHMFYAFFSDSQSGPATIYTQVNCYHGSIAEGDLATTTYHVFSTANGIPTEDPLLNAWIFNKWFGCVYQTEDPPKETVGGGM